MKTFISTITPLIKRESHYAEITQKIISALVKGRGIEGKEGLKEVIEARLPLLHYLPDSNNPLHLSFYLFSVSRPDSLKFFLEFITRFLVPDKKLTAGLLFAVDFRFEGISDEVFTAAELSVTLEGEQDFRIIEERQEVFESQLRLGMASTYHALRVLEMKELLHDQKTSLIQDSIILLVKRGRFDNHLIAEMQQFLVTTSEGFRAKRSLRHLNRLICLLHLFKRKMEEHLLLPELSRHCLIKVMRSHTRVQSESVPVLALLVAVNLITEQEVFENHNLTAAIQSILPGVKMKSGSSYVSFTGRNDVRVLYAEFTKEGDKSFTHEEIKKLRKILPETVSQQVEELLHPIFMPHNEEEIIRNIVTLSKQLRFVKDIPQVIITFNEHTGSDISFTVILLRLLKKETPSIEKLFRQGEEVSFVKERVKVVGLLRKTYPKEANVFYLTLKKKPFIRQDRSIDLYKARQKVLEELIIAFGPVRDYNGGMLSKHREVFEALKEKVEKLSQEEEFLLENFFYGITPVIMKNLLELKLLKSWFVLFLASCQEEESGKIVEKEEEGAFFMIITLHKKEHAHALYTTLLKENLHTTHFAAVLLKRSGVHFLCLFYRGAHEEERAQWREGVVHLLGNCYT